MKRRLLIPIILSGLLLAGCASSSETTTDPTPDAVDIPSIEASTPTPTGDEPPVEDAQAAVDDYLASNLCTRQEPTSGAFSDCLREAGTRVAADAGEESAIRIVSPPIIASLGEATAANATGTEEVVVEGTYSITFESGVVEVLTDDGTGQYGWATVDLTKTPDDEKGFDFNKVWKYTPAGDEYTKIESPSCYIMFTVNLESTVWTCSTV